MSPCRTSPDMLKGFECYVLPSGLLILAAPDATLKTAWMTRRSLKETPALPRALSRIIWLSVLNAAD